MLEILLGVALFTLIILSLVGVILFARSKLVATGLISVKINDDPDKEIQATAGESLLTLLADQEIFLASACGGRGVCGMCQVKVLAGGGQVLPTEKDLLTKKQIAEGYRLACQLHLKQELKLELPANIFETGKWECEVVSNESVATFIKELVLKLPEGEALEFKSGSYLQLEALPHHLKYADIEIAEKYHQVWDSLGLWALESKVDAPLHRAYSLANYAGEEGGLKFNVRIALAPPGSSGVPPGKMSSYLFSLRAGDKVAISGPYGNFFPQQSDAEMVYIGGGAGMAPMRSHIFHLLKQAESKRKISYWYGARSLCEVFYQAEFDQLQAEHDNFEWHVALSDPQPEDNWQGYSGFIHQILYDHYLQNHSAPEECEYYICGPPIMLSCVLKMLQELGVSDESIFYDDFGG
ncbi:Na(+)-translocating NADH-quinone reductase subunit F [hydrothermal vent metagenome]|uniref:Na(+)-translocating NADH-quinone reductase subunit F n=1 Tax=hydrothermal vent metagenome TaxID=652676 RepID=A0A3B1BK56_9ZZZZ